MKNPELNAANISILEFHETIKWKHLNILQSRSNNSNEHRRKSFEFYEIVESAHALLSCFSYLHLGR